MSRGLNLFVCELYTSLNDATQANSSKQHATEVAGVSLPTKGSLERPDSYLEIHHSKLTNHLNRNTQALRNPQGTEPLKRK